MNFDFRLILETKEEIIEFNRICNTFNEDINIKREDRKDIFDAKDLDVCMELFSGNSMCHVGIISDSDDIHNKFYYDVRDIQINLRRRKLNEATDC